jgi:hypothetical protein
MTGSRQATPAEVALGDAMAAAGWDVTHPDVRVFSQGGVAHITLRTENGVAIFKATGGSFVPDSYSSFKGPGPVGLTGAPAGLTPQAFQKMVDDNGLDTPRER